MRIGIIQNTISGMRQMMKIKDSHLEEIKQVLPNAQISVIDDTSENITQQLKDCEIIIMSGFGHVDFKETKNLKWVHITSAGVNNIPEHLMNSDIFITNSSGVHPIPISEQVLGYMLMFARRLADLHRKQLLEKKWDSDLDSLQQSELSGKTVGIVGLGRIGSRIARLAKAFEMKVLAVTHSKRDKEEFVDEIFTIDQLDDVLKNSDYVVSAIPLTKETQHLYTLDKFQLMKPSAYFINIGRGPSVKEDDLLKALQGKIIAGAALDVFEEEPLPSSSPLWNLENIIITPHSSGLTPYYMDRVIKIFSENLKSYLSQKPLPNLVDKKKGY